MPLEKLAALRAELDEITDIDERAEVLIEYAERFHEVPPEIAARPFSKDRLVPGCESEAYAWLVTDSSGPARPYFAVENPQGISAKALGAILSETLGDVPVTEYRFLEDQLVNEIFGHTVSMGKGQGLMNMVRAVRALAEARQVTQ